MEIHKKWRSKMKITYSILFFLGIFLGTEAHSFTNINKSPDIWSLNYDEVHKKLLVEGVQIILANKGSWLVVRSNSSTEEQKAYLFSSGQLCSIDTYKESKETKNSWYVTVHELEKNGPPLKTVSLITKISDGYGLVWKNRTKIKILQTFSIRYPHNPISFVTLETIVDTAVCPNYRLPKWVTDSCSTHL